MVSCQFFIHIFVIFLTLSKSYGGMVPIGEFCRDSNSCVGSEQSSKCVNFTCTCNEGYVAKYDSTNCLPIRDQLEEECEEAPQCRKGRPGQYSNCLSTLDFVPEEKACRCEGDSLNAPDDHTCYLKVKLGEKCESTLECQAHIGNLSLCTDNKCACSLPSVPSETGEKCLKSEIPIGGGCEQNDQCVGKQEGTSKCDFTTKKCTCVEGYIANEKNSTCLPVVHKLGDQCKEVQQCSSGDPGEWLECDIRAPNPEKVCKCKIGATDNLPDDQDCYPLVTFVDEECKVEKQCDVSLGQASTCSNGTCKCEDRFIPSASRKKCIEVGHLGQPCEEDVQCGHIGNATCQGSSGSAKCECHSGFNSSVEAGVEKCHKAAGKLGEPCEISQQCVGLQASCDPKTSTCQCDINNQVPSLRNTTCLNIVNQLNVTCQDNIQCKVDHASCTGDKETTKKCTCSPGEFVESWNSNNTCVPIVSEINAPCDEHVQCRASMGDKSECQNVCLCMTRYEFYGGKCYLPVRLGGICKSSEECYLGATNNSYCEKAADSQLRCRCASGAIESDGLCYAPKRVGDYCKNNLECSVAIPGEVVCDLSVNSCQCKVGYKPELDGGICFSSASFKKTSILVVLVMFICKVFSN